MATKKKRKTTKKRRKTTTVASARKAVSTAITAVAKGKKGSRAKLQRAITKFASASCRVKK